MANTQSVCSSFRLELMNGIHAFGVSVVRAGTGADTLKAALFLVSASLGAGTTAYAATGEVSGAGYTAGGVAVANANPPANTGGTGIIAFWTPSASFSWTAVTLATPFDTVLLYNSTQGNKAIMVFTFGAQTVTAGTFTITMPSNDLTNGLIRLN